MCHKCNFNNISYLAGFKISKWNLPYNDKKTTLDKKLTNQPGVYLIKSKQTGEIKYVGYSSNNLKRTLYRHFQQHNDREQERFIFDRNKHLIRVIGTTKDRAPLLEKYLIDKYKPKANKNKYSKKKPKDFKKDLKLAKEWKTFYGSSTVQDTPF